MIGEQDGFTPAFAGVQFRTTDGDPDGANLSGMTLVTVTARADEPTVAVVTVDAGFPAGRPAVMPVDLGFEHSTQVLPLHAFGRPDAAACTRSASTPLLPATGGCTSPSCASTQTSVVA